MTVRKLAYLAVVPALWVLYALSFLAPRKPRRIAFGSMQDQFSENSRYLFLSLVNEHARDGVEIAWVSGSSAVVEALRSQGYVAHCRWSLRGLAFCLTAGTYVTSAYLSDVNFWTSGRCTHLSLWHGIPLKKIERDITVGPLAAQFRPGIGAVPARLALPQKFRLPEFVVSPCTYTDAIFARAFGVSTASVVRSIYPRSAHLVRRRAQAGTTGRRTVLFCPTWRDRSTAGDVQALKDCIATLDRHCELQGYRLLVKLHPNVAKRDDMAAVVGTRAPAGDLYDALAEASLVVTDYSSILFECILARIPLLLHSYDGDAYERSSRDLYFDPKQTFAEVWVRELDGLDVAQRIAIAEAHLDGYRSHLGFYDDDGVTPLLVAGAFGSDRDAQDGANDRIRRAP